MLAFASGCAFSQPPEKAEVCEIVVVGGGLVGSLTALALARRGFCVQLLERSSPAAIASMRDGRSTAIAYGSAMILERLGIDIREHAQAIRHIRIADGSRSEGRGGVVSRFLRAGGPVDIPTSGSVEEAGHILSRRVHGYVVDNPVLRKKFACALSSCAGVVYKPSATVRSLRPHASGIDAELTDGRRLRAQLLVAADGRHSSIRKQVGIETLRWDYRQEAVVCQVAHARPHNGLAWEYFLSSGPLALLPMCASAGAPHRSSLIWSTSPQDARRKELMPPSIFAQKLQARFPDNLGDFRIYGNRWRHGLSFCLARRVFSHRVVLVGDAAHAIHPVAGQGFNLGVRDADTLAQQLQSARRVGLETGNLQVLKEYDRLRRPDVVAMAFATDALIRLFSNNVLPLRMFRRMGLGLTQKMPRLKGWLARYAAGF